MALRVRVESMVPGLGHVQVYPEETCGAFLAEGTDDQRHVLGSLSLLGITQERVREIQTGGLRLLHQYIDTELVDDYSYQWQVVKGCYVPIHPESFPDVRSQEPTVVRFMELGPVSSSLGFQRY